MTFSASAQPDPDKGDFRKLSVVIPCYNGRRYLEQCLTSVVTLLGSQVDALVVDDGSTEDIRSIVDRFAPTVRYFRQTNQGVSRARNAGIARTSRPYIRFLDADDYLVAGTALQEQLDCLDAHPEVGLVYGQAVNIDALGTAFGLSRPPFARDSYVHTGDEELRQLLLGSYITTSSVVVRRSVLDRIGPFRPDFMTSEDWDRWLQLARVASIAYIAKPVVAYRSHDGSLTGRNSAVALERNHQRIIDDLFADPQFADRFQPLRRSVLARQHQAVAEATHRDGNGSRARAYAARALAHAVTAADWHFAARCTVLIAKSLTPARTRKHLKRWIGHARRLA